MRVSKFLTPFIIISILHLAGEAMTVELMSQVTKPLLMAALIYYFVKSVQPTPINKLVTLALGLSLLGDTALMFQADNSIFFMAGLAFFLLAHIVYAWINFNLVNDDNRKFRLAWKDAPIIIAGFAIFLLIKDGVDDLRIPVLSYIVVISIMAITARQRAKRVDKESFWLIMTGAICFMLSDSLLAMDKFLNPIEMGRIWIMLTYILAQYLIVKGIIVFIQKIRPEAGS